MKHKEIRLEARVRNNILWHAIYDAWPSMRDFCKFHNLSYQLVSRLLNLSYSPSTQRGEYAKICKKLSAVLGIPAAELFPFWLYEVESPSVVREVTFAELPAARAAIALLPTTTNPFDLLIQQEDAAKVHAAIASLRPAERVVIEMYHGMIDGREHTFSEIKALQGGTPQSLYHKALGKVHRKLIGERQAETAVLRKYLTMRASRLIVAETDLKVTDITYVTEDEAATHYTRRAGTKGWDYSLGIMLPAKHRRRVFVDQYVEIFPPQKPRKPKEKSAKD